MNSFNQFTKRLGELLRAGWRRLLAALGWLVVMLQTVGIALYKQLRYDFDLVWMKIRGSSTHLQGRQIQSWNDVQQIAIEWTKKLKPVLLVSDFSRTKAQASRKKLC